jgi:hypothetical protein
MITRLVDLAVRVVTLRGKTAVEKRVEILAVDDGEPVLSLPPGDARALGWMLRQHARNAEN